eukprot:Seg1893.1 transcript_id=Seg1893.1/GoldUCD/mRNA.D3Y31 product="hypothetical protein" protein_id=Seg1893.1/GoldUCD/D3Y31
MTTQDETNVLDELFSTSEIFDNAITMTTQDTFNVLGEMFELIDDNNTTPIQVTNIDQLNQVSSNSMNETTSIDSPLIPLTYEVSSISPITFPTLIDTIQQEPGSFNEDILMQSAQSLLSKSEKYIWVNCYDVFVEANALAQEALVMQMIKAKTKSIFVMRGLNDLPCYGGEEVIVVCMPPNRMSKLGIFRLRELCETGRLCSLTGVIRREFFTCPKLIVVSRGRLLKRSIVDYATFYPSCKA